MTPQPLRIVSSMATRALLADLLAAWHAQGGAPAALEAMGGVDAARRDAAGEAYDVAVLASDALARLADGGHVVPDSRVDLMRSTVAIAVRAGAPHPRIDDAAALRAAVLAAPRIGYSTGPSGQALLQRFERWGLHDAVRDRLVQAPPGVPVGAMLACGEVDLGFQQRSELVGLPGIDVLGEMPPGTEIVTVFSAARCRASARPDAAAALLAGFAAAAGPAIAG